MEAASASNFSMSADFVLFVTTFRIIVLTWNRPKSLQRLLNSLENSDYGFSKNNPNWDLVLEIRIDGGGEEEGEATKKIARDFKFSSGRKVIVEDDVNRGIMQVWRRAWTWRERELFVIIEDDVSMSPHWYRALVNMWTKYGSNPAMAGLGLQRQTYVADGRHDEDISARVEDSVFLYQLPASIGCSPHPWHWNEMIRQHGDSFGSCPPGMGCVKEVWEAWWLRYSLDNNIYTLYAASQKGFAVDHREKGYHYQEGLGNTTDKIDTWLDSWELENLPHKPVKLDLALNEVSDLSHAAKRIAGRFGAVIIRVLTQDNVEKTIQQYKDLSEDELKTLDPVLFVVSSKDLYSKASILPNIVLESPVWLNQTRAENETYVSRYWLHLLKHLSTLAIKVVSLPAEISLNARPVHERAISTNIAAGKKKNQKSPSLDHLYLDGSFNTFNMFQELHRNKEYQFLQDNFLADFTNELKTQHTITWSWITDFVS